MSRASTADAERVDPRSDFWDGSTGARPLPVERPPVVSKERLEVFYGAGVSSRSTTAGVMRGFWWPGFGTMRMWRQDKRQAACVRPFVDAAAEGGPSPDPSRRTGRGRQGDSGGRRRSRRLSPRAVLPYLQAPERSRQLVGRVRFAFARPRPDVSAAPPDRRPRAPSPCRCAGRA